VAPGAKGVSAAGAVVHTLPSRLRCARTQKVVGALSFGGPVCTVSPPSSINSSYVAPPAPSIESVRTSRSVDRTRSGGVPDAVVRESPEGYVRAVNSINRWEESALRPDAMVREADVLHRPGSVQLPMKKDATDFRPWSVTQTVRLGTEGDEDRIICGQTRLLDPSLVRSVSGAVEQLNKGAVRCPEGLCVVYSASSRAYFLLYRCDMRELAVARAKKSEEGGARVAESAHAPEQSHQQQTASAASPESCEGASGSAGGGAGGVVPMLRKPLASSATGASAAAGGGVASPKCSSPKGDRSIGGGGSPLSKGCSRRMRSTGNVRRIDSLPKPLPPPSDEFAAAAEQEVADALAACVAAASPAVMSPPQMSPQTPTPPEPEATPLVPSGKDTVQETPSGSDNLDEAVSGAWTEPLAPAAVMSPTSVDTIVEIGRRRFELLQVIGRGAFGVVWLARDLSDSGHEVAMKAVSAKDVTGFATAKFEAELLQILTAAMPASSKAHVPQYIAHNATRSGGGGIVRLAMSFIPGGALDKWLYGISDEEHKTVDVAQLVDGHLPGGQQGSWWFEDACAIVRDLLSQLSGVFASLLPIAFHRDVSSHNVLVDFRDTEQPMKPSFALIDFGLAVRSGSWNREWRNSNLAGDPRYWTPSAWMAFAFGFKYVATHPNSGFHTQYLNRMDHFSIGVLGLEVLFALWHTGEAYEGKQPGMLEVRAAWCKYWVPLIHLFQMFHRQGAQEVRQFLAQSQDEGVTCLVNHLRQLRQSLRAAASLNARCAALLLVLADLIDEKGTVTWEEIPSMLGEDLPTTAVPTTAAATVMGTEAGPAAGGGGASPLAGSSASVAASAPTGEATTRRRSRSTMRSSLALIEPQPFDTRAEHRRIRSTGGTLDSELRRFEPEISQARFQATQPPQYPQWGVGSSSPQAYVGDGLSRSFTHVRHISGFM